MQKYFCLFLSLLFLSGCSLDSPGELERLTKEDPNFKQMIVQRDQIHAQIRTIKDDLLVKKKAMDVQVDKLHQDYDVYAKTQNGKIEKYRGIIENYRAVLKREMEVANERLSSKTIEQGGYQKTLADVKKVLTEGKGITLSSQEKQKWEERVQQLTEKLRPLMEEIQDIKLQIRLKKQKINYLK